jgi:hypothetical protein
MGRMLSQEFPNKKIVVAGLIDSDLSEFNVLLITVLKKL